MIPKRLSRSSGYFIWLILDRWPKETGSGVIPVWLSGGLRAADREFGFQLLDAGLEGFVIVHGFDDGGGGVGQGFVAVNLPSALGPAHHENDLTGLSRVIALTDDRTVSLTGGNAPWCFDYRLCPAAHRLASM